jgi:hypothetical protein
MRLSNEQLKHIKKWFADCEEKDYIPENGLTIGGLLDTIEFLQQENEQLKAQAAVMREALKSIYYGPYQMHKGYVEILEEALSTDAGKDYHNPTDIEALKKAREALGQATYTEELLPDWKYKKIVYEAIRAIDKAIGGSQHENKI